MATLAVESTPAVRSDDGFFLRGAIAMALVIVAGFSLQFAMGRSSFSAPLLVHAHAVVFMGWVAIYLTQTMLATRGPIALHRRLGWVAAGWVVLMVVLGCAITAAMVRRGQAPFFFRPQHFLVFNPLSILTFAALTAAAIHFRRQTDWHRRLHFCGMALLLGPGFGRLLPMPLLQPYAFEATFLALMIFPLVGIASDLRRSGRAHPAWLWGIGVMVGSVIVTQAVTYSPAGRSLYLAVTDGTPGASVAPLDFAAPPAGPVTGRS